MNYRTIAIAASAALVLVSSSWAYTSWAGGSVIYTVPGHGRHTLKIRQIPLQPPGLNDGYAYRCEVWAGAILVQASTYTQDSWTATRVSITQSAGKVVFHLDGYDIAGPSPGISTPDGDWSGVGHQ
jgi:hypothetical protein